VFRAFTATTFLAAILAFALPFGAVSSCDGERVEFTGAQLVTLDVQPDRKHHGTLHHDVEHNCIVFALVVLAASIIGLGLVAAGERGAGICAAVGLFAAQLLGWAILFSGEDESFLDAGFWLALVALAIAAIAFLIRAARERRRHGYRTRRYVAGRVVVVLLPILGPLVIGLLAAATALP
jgi:hypothetical protein